MSLHHRFTVKIVGSDIEESFLLSKIVVVTILLASPYVNTVKIINQESGSFNYQEKIAFATT